MEQILIKQLQKVKPLSILPARPQTPELSKYFSNMVLDKT